MIKIMRKNRKVLLAIFGALLMVMFLLSGPQSIFQPDPMKQVVATVGSREVRLIEQNEANMEYEALKAFAPSIIEGLDIEHGAHWMLLAEEAQKAGLVGDQGDGRRLIPQIAEITVNMMARGLPPDQVTKFVEQFTNQMENVERPRVAGQFRMSLEDFDRTLAKLQGVVRLRGQYFNALRISDKRGIMEVKENYDAVVVDGMSIPAERLLSTVAEPSEEEVQAQFQKYKDVPPGTGEFGFGYIQPPRVKYEVLTLDRQAFRSVVKLDPVAVSKHYLQNKAKYPGDPATETARAREDLLNARVDAMMNDADRLYTSRLKPELRNLPQVNGARTLPADWKDKGIRLAALSEAIREGMQAAGYDLSPTVTIRNEGWIKVSELGRAPGVGTARFRVGTVEGDFRKLVENMRELNPASTVGFQAGVPFEGHLIDSVTQNRYYVNVIDWRPESAAESIEEVRADVVRDVKLKAAYDKLVAMASELKSQAVTEGMDKIAGAYASPAPLGANDPTPRPVPVFRYATINRQFGTGELNQKEVRDAAMDLANTLGVKVVATPENKAERTIAVPVPSKLSLAIVEVLGHKSITLEDMRTLSRAVYNRFSQQELSENAPPEDPFSFEAMQKRYDYQTAKDEKAKKTS